MKKNKGKKVVVENYESRLIQQCRVIEYWLEKEFPNDWDEMNVNEQGIWINENADFIKDEFEDPHYSELTTEETVDIVWDEDE